MTRSDADADVLGEATDLALPLLHARVVLLYDLTGAEDEALLVREDDPELIIDVLGRPRLIRGC